MISVSGDQSVGALAHEAVSNKTAKRLPRDGNEFIFYKVVVLPRSTRWFGMPAGSPTKDNAESATSKDCVEPPSAFSKIINCLHNTTDCRQKVIGNDQKFTGVWYLELQILKNKKV